MLDCRLTQDMIYELSPSLDLSDARTLDLPSCGVRSVDLSPFDLLKNLARYECFLVSGVSFEVGSNVKLYTLYILLQTQCYCLCVGQRKTWSTPESLHTRLPQYNMHVSSFLRVRILPSSHPLLTKSPLPSSPPPC